MEETNTNMAFLKMNQDSFRGNSKETEKKWYTTLNPNNLFITKEEIQKILKKGNINIPINDINKWQRAFVHKSYIIKSNNNKKTSSESDTTDSDSDSTNSDSSKQNPKTKIEDLEKRYNKKIVPLQEKSNERLEWLGDAQLGSAVTQYLFKRYPNENEGFLTKLRSKLVQTKNLSYLAQKLGLDSYLILSYYVEFGCQGRSNKKILENTFESFIGAMYLDFSNPNENTENYAYGSEVVRRFIITIIEKYVDIVEMVMKDDNYKDSLMWYFQKNFNGAFPIYNKEKFENEYFYIYVKEPNSEKIVGRGSARSKKQAEQKAAKDALKYYKKITN
jgi:dsRNA-specific ribonuclease